MTTFEHLPRQAITDEEIENALYSHILIRTDLPLEAQMAQAVHAGQEAMRFNPTAARPIHVVILACPDEKNLLLASESLERAQIDFHLFYEPHWPKGYTALGCAPQVKTPALKRALARFELWKAPVAPAQPDIVIEDSGEPLNAKVTVSDSKMKHAAMSFAISHLYDALFSAHYALEKRDIDEAKRGLDYVMERIESMKCQDEYHPDFGLEIAELYRFDAFKEELHQIHCGDCTAVPSSCTRCHMERLLGIDTGPQNKAEGWRMLAQYNQKMEALKNAATAVTVDNPLSTESSASSHVVEASIGAEGMSEVNPIKLDEPQQTQQTSTQTHDTKHAAKMKL